jgi:hypothetical protein
MEQFEAWLADKGIAVAGQFATGSGSMVRLRLKLLDGAEIDLVVAAETLAERPEEAIRQVENLLARHEVQKSPGNGHAAPERGE